MNMKSAFLILLVLAMLSGMAAAAEITAVVPSAPAGGYPAGEVVTIPIQIIGADQLGFLKATVSATGGSVSIRKSGLGNTEISTAGNTVVWYGNYEGGVLSASAYNTSGYSNAGTATLFYLDVTPGSAQTVVTAAFPEIWKVTSENQIPMYLGNNDRLVLTIGGNSEPTIDPRTQALVKYDANAEVYDYVPPSEIAQKGSVYTITARRAIASDLVFTGWLLNGNEVDDTINVDDDITLYADWIELPGGFNPTARGLRAVGGYVQTYTYDENYANYDLDGNGRFTFLELVLLSQYVADHLDF